MTSTQVVFADSVSNLVLWVLPFSLANNVSDHMRLSEVVIPSSCSIKATGTLLKVAKVRLATRDGSSNDYSECCFSESLLKALCRNF